MSANVETVDALLPQYQCERCGYGGCRPYAEAIASGETDINRCPPGGTLVIEDLARLLGREAPLLDPDCGGIQPATVARIDEQACIGCTKCLPACPVDAIVGVPKRLHEVIEAACTGCGLCLPPCPVDCIRLEPVESEAEAETRLHPPAARRKDAQRRLHLRSQELRERYENHRRRLARRVPRHRREPGVSDAVALDNRRAEVLAAVARVRARRFAR